MTPEGAAYLLFIEDENGDFRLAYPEFFSHRSVSAELDGLTSNHILVDVPHKVSIEALAESLRINRKLMEGK